MIVLFRTFLGGIRVMTRGFSSDFGSFFGLKTVFRIFIGFFGDILFYPQLCLYFGGSLRGTRPFLLQEAELLRAWKANKFSEFSAFLLIEQWF